MKRCHSVFSWGCSSLFFHQVLVARERMASVRPVFFLDFRSGLLPKNPISSTRFSYIFFQAPFSALVIGALESERGLLPRRASAFREGHKKSSLSFAQSFWEETEKQKSRSCRAQEFPRSRAQWKGRNGDKRMKRVQSGFWGTGSTIHAGRNARSRFTCW